MNAMDAGDSTAKPERIPSVAVQKHFAAAGVDALRAPPKGITIAARARERTPLAL